MKIGSLFSGGCGGLELGLERAGVGHTIWQVEIDESARRNLKRHWPDARQYADVKEFRYVDGIERPDVICGGFPCQDVSIAGAGKGLEGARSGLWYEYLRIVREMEPRFVVVENVVALSFRGLGTVIGGLSEAGYSAIWFPLRAADVGATHRRERLFIVAYRDGEGEPQQKGPVSESGGWAGDGGNVGYPEGIGRDARRLPVRAKERQPVARGYGADVGHANGPRLGGRGLRGCGRADERAFGPAGAEVVYSDGGGCGTSGGFGNGSEVGSWRDNSDLPPATPDTSTMAHAVRLESEPRGGSGDVDRKGRADQGQRGQRERRRYAFGDCREDSHDFPPGPGDIDAWREYLARYPNRAPAVPNAKGKPTLNPTFVEALMGFPEDWTSGTRTERLKQLGNAVVPQCAEVAGYVLRGVAEREGLL